jgi:hypothetical protein
VYGVLSEKLIGMPDLKKYSVTIKFPNWGHKATLKRVKTIYYAVIQCSLFPLLHTVYTGQRFFPYRLSISRPNLFDRCKISNMAPFIAIHNLENKINSAAAKSEGRVDGIARGPLVLPRTRRHRQMNVPVHCRAEDTRMHLPEIRA